MNDARETAVREAFWNNTPESGYYEFARIHDVLLETDVCSTPTTAQIKSFFMMLPIDIFGTALAFGFSDTEVGDRMYEFVKKNKDKVKSEIFEPK